MQAHRQLSKQNTPLCCRTQPHPMINDQEHSFANNSTGPTAIDEVIKKTPPSGLALNVGRASRKRCMLPLQLIAQHCGKSLILNAEQCGSWKKPYLVPVCFRECMEVCKSGEFRPALIQRSTTPHQSKQPKKKQSGSTAFEIMTSNPPKPLILSFTIFTQSSKTPTSYIPPNKTQSSLAHHHPHTYTKQPPMPSRKENTNPLNDHSLDSKFPLDLLRRTLCPLEIRHVVDGDVAAFGGEFGSYERAETSVVQIKAVPLALD